MYSCCLSAAYSFSFDCNISDEFIPILCRCAKFPKTFCRTQAQTNLRRHQKRFHQSSQGGIENIMQIKQRTFLSIIHTYYYTNQLHSKKKIQYLMNITLLTPLHLMFAYLVCILEDILGSGQLEFIEIFDILHMLFSLLQILSYFGAQKRRNCG